MTETNGRGAEQGSGASFKPADAAAAAKPVIDAGHAVFEEVAVRAERYFEHWVDLVEEIKAEQEVPDQEDLDLADIIANLADAEVASESTGRVRLRLHELQGQPLLAEQLADALVAVPGIKRVQVSAITGSVLIFFNARDYPSVDDLLDALVA